MKLDDFLKEKAFQKYNREIDAISREFIDMGCEKFLWRNFREEKNSMEKTKIFFENMIGFHENSYISLFMNQFNGIDWNKEIAFIYPEHYSDNFFIIEDICKNANRKKLINNMFEQDDTINHVAVFDNRDIEKIELMFHLVYSSFMGDNFGGYKLFDKDLMYYFDNLEYGGVVLQPKWPNLLAHFQGNNTRRDTNPFKILESRKATKLVMEQNYFSNELELFRNLYEFVLPVFQKWYNTTEEVIKNSAYDWKKKKEIIYSRLVTDGKIQIKWKSELTLFKLIQKEYPNSIYQCRPDWLSPQSLDIFIPELNVGIEYQGIQHYQKVDYFGGEEGLVHRQMLDNKKRQKCKENDIALIEWSYNEEITKVNFRNKVKSISKS